METSTDDRGALATVRHNLTVARRAVRYYSRVLATVPEVIYAGDPRDPQWSRQCKRRAALITATAHASNLAEVVAAYRYDADPRAYRWDRHLDMITISGDWTMDMGGGDQLCDRCAHDAVLSGDLCDSDMHPCYSHVQDIEDAIRCDQCGTLIRLGCECIAVLSATALEDLYPDDPYDPDTWEWEDLTAVSEYILQDGEQSEAIEKCNGLCTGTGTGRGRGDDRYLAVIVWGYGNGGDIFYDTSAPAPVTP